MSTVLLLPNTTINSDHFSNIELQSPIPILLENEELMGANARASLQVMEILKSAQKLTEKPIIQLKNKCYS